MKKRILILLFLSFFVLMTNFNSVMAYSPHYLPGGKNYLTPENFFWETESDYVSINPFLVKPYTNYVLTFPKAFCENQYLDHIITFFDENGDSSQIHIYEGETTDIIFEEKEWTYYQFMTNADTLYMQLELEDSWEYIKNHPFEFQLEEGVEFTGYEAYSPGELIDTSAPYFEDVGTVISYYDSPITIEEIKDSLTAYDSIDGDLTNSITVVSDNYTINTDKLGVYECVFGVSDSSGNSSEVTVQVELVDVLKPVFSNVGVIKAVYPNTYSQEDILSFISASDNYDGDLTSQIQLINDEYTDHSTLVGTYYMEYSVSDSSGNTQTYRQAIEVVDEEAPMISGITSIVVGYDSYLTESEIISNLSCTDNYDSSSSLSLVLENDNYTDNSNTIGSYEVIYSVTDSSGNKTIQPITINVVDQMGPVVYFNSTVIQTYTDTVMQLPDFTQLLIHANEIDAGVDYYVSVRYDSYTKNAKTPGIYHLKLSLEDEIGNQFDKDLEIRVIERPADYIFQDNSVIEPEKSFFETYKNIILGGSLTMVLVASNVTWIVIFKKKK